jgi:hypothetical protein
MLIEYEPRNFTPPRECALDLGVITLKNGGIHEVRKADWDKVMTNPIVQHLIEIGVLRVVVANEDDAPTMIDGLSPIKAISLVQNTYELPLLRRWQQSESRTTVLAAINAQIESIRNPELKDDSAQPKKRGRIIEPAPLA